ncbi:uncharacterized protein [Phaseolus vulgaris]|uniref:uncharacterized protein n=1 Tax=Phaseolus vulgaris TaxID=3885 RepID=UPI0035CA99AF
MEANGSFKNIKEQHDLVRQVTKMLEKVELPENSIVHWPHSHPLYYKTWVEIDPLLLQPWLTNDVALDMILLENQFPFFVLEGLYNLAIPHHETLDLPSFLNVAFNYFKPHNQQNIRPEKVHSSTKIFIRNIIAFEQCHHLCSPNYITEYIMILDFLINTGKDVNILVEKKILVNLLDDDAVATMVNNLCCNVTLPYIKSGYRSLCDELNGFYENPRNKYKAIFIHDYLR